MNARVKFRHRKKLKQSEYRMHHAKALKVLSLGIVIDFFVNSALVKGPLRN